VYAVYEPETNEPKLPPEPDDDPQMPEPTLLIP